METPRWDQLARKLGTKSSTRVDFDKYADSPHEVQARLRITAVAGIL